MGQFRMQGLFICNSTYSESFLTNHTGMTAGRAAMAAARNKVYGGTKPAPFIPMASSPISNEMIGPTIIGIRTMKHMGTLI